MKMHLVGIQDASESGLANFFDLKKQKHKKQTKQNKTKQNKTKKPDLFDLNQILKI